MGRLYFRLSAHEFEQPCQLRRLRENGFLIPSVGVAILDSQIFSASYTAKYEMIGVMHVYTMIDLSLVVFVTDWSISIKRCCDECVRLFPYFCAMLRKSQLKVDNRKVSYAVIRRHWENTVEPPVATKSSHNIMKLSLHFLQKRRSFFQRLRFMSHLRCSGLSLSKVMHVE